MYILDNERVMFGVETIINHINYLFIYSLITILYYYRSRRRRWRDNDLFILVLLLNMLISLMHLLVVIQF